MTFNDEIKKNSSKKHSLIKLRTKKLSGTSFVSGNLFEATIESRFISSVESYGYGVLEIIGSGDPTEGQCRIDSENLKVITYAEDTESLLIEYFHLFSCGKNIVANIDPLDLTSEVAEWRGLVISEPDFEESVDNINAGILTINNSQIKLFNKDGELDYFLEKYRVVNGCPFEVYFVCNGFASFGFSGTTSSVSTNGKELSISTSDIFEKLSSTCYMGDPSSYCSVLLTTFPNTHEQGLNRVIPLTLGPTSHSKNGFVVSNTTIDPNGILHDSLLQATCVDYSATKSGTTNRQWVADRCIDSGKVWLNVNYTNPTPPSLSYAIQLNSLQQVSQFIAGGSFLFGGLLATVTSVEIPQMKIYASLSETGTLPPSPTTIESFEIPLVSVRHNTLGEWYLNPKTDYTVTTVNVPGGKNKLRTIVFTENFDEAIFGTGNFISPEDFDVRFRSTAIGLTHAEVIEKMFNALNIAFDSSSVSTSDFCCMNIPTIDDSFGSYLDYAQKICESTNGFICTSTSGEAKFKEFLSTTTPVLITDDDIIDGSFSVRKNEDDFYSSVIGISENCSSIFEQYETFFSFSKMLLGESREKTLTSVNYPLTVPAIYIDKMTRSHRVYEFKTKTIGYDFEIGQDLSYNGIEMTVISISKSVGGVSMAATDMFYYED